MSTARSETVLQKLFGESLRSTLSNAEPWRISDEVSVGYPDLFLAHGQLGLWGECKVLQSDRLQKTRGPRWNGEGPRFKLRHELTGPQHDFLRRNWLRPVYSGVILFEDPASLFAVLPYPLLGTLFYAGGGVSNVFEMPWEPIPNASPATVLRSMRNAWAQLNQGPLPNMGHFKSS